MDNVSSDISSWLPVITDRVIPWLLIVIGWVVVHYLSRHRDLAKRRRDFCSETRKLIEEIERQSIEYHTSTTRLHELEKAIKQSLDRLERRINVQKAHLGITTQEMIHFRQIVTASNFETAQFSQQETYGKLINSISAQANELCDKLLLKELC